MCLRMSLLSELIVGNLMKKSSVRRRIGGICFDAISMSGTRYASEMSTWDCEPSLLCLSDAARKDVRGGFLILELVRSSYISYGRGF